MRCESVTSSLELGYSHTAQHSALSETCELDYSQSAHCTASSGVYTLDGSCDNHTVIETVASSSGIGLESQGKFLNYFLLGWNLVYLTYLTTA